MLEERHGKGHGSAGISRRWDVQCYGRSEGASKATVRPRFVQFHHPGPPCQPHEKQTFRTEAGSESNTRAGQWRLQAGNIDFIHPRSLGTRRVSIRRPLKVRNPHVSHYRGSRRLRLRIGRSSAAVDCSRWKYCNRHLMRSVGFAMLSPFSELWDRSQGSSARLSTPSTASDLQPCCDAQGSMVRGYRWPVARLRFDVHVMARFLTRNPAGSTVLTWVWITKLLKISPFPVHG